MKNLFTFFTCLFLTTLINAQSVEIEDTINPEWHQSGDVQFGAFLGFTTNILSFDEDFDVDEDQNGNGFLIGAKADYYLGKNWSLKARLNYEKRDFGAGISANYVAVPLGVAWHFGKNRRWHLSLGAAYNASLSDNFESGFGGDFNIGVVIPISKVRFFIEIDGISQLDATEIIITDENGNPIGTGGLNSSRSSLNFGILF